MVKLAFAAFFFLALHLGVAATPMRTNLIAWMGRRPYQATFSFGSLLSIGMLFLFYRGARTDSLNLVAWVANPLTSSLALILVFFSFLLFFATLIPGAQDLAPEGRANLALSRLFNRLLKAWPILGRLGLSPAQTALQFEGPNLSQITTPRSGPMGDSPSGAYLTRLNALSLGSDSKDPPPALPRVRGIWRITRHPRLWALAFWAMGHLLAHLDLAALFLFGTILVFSVLFGQARDQLRATSYEKAGLGDDYAMYLYKTSSFPFQAIRAGRNRMALDEIGPIPLVMTFAAFTFAMVFHEILFSVPPL